MDYLPGTIPQQGTSLLVPDMERAEPGLFPTPR
jgi:hypothetical protein